MLALLLAGLLLLPEDVAALVRDLGSEDPGARAAAAEKLAALGEEAKSALLEAARAEDPEVAASAREVLLRIEKDRREAGDRAAKARWTEALKGVVAGNSKEETTAVVQAARPGDHDDISGLMRFTTPFSLFRLDRDWNFYVTYDGAGDVATAEVCGFPDLISRVDPAYGLLRAVHDAPSLSARDFDPAALLRAVNLLQAAGREAAVKALEGYLALAAAEPEERVRFSLDGERVAAIARLLYVPRDGGPALPALEIGVTGAVPKDGSTWPLFPLALRDGVPFWVAGTVEGVRSGELAKRTLAWCEANGRFRAAPLEPGDPLAAADALTSSDGWKALEFAKRGEASVRSDVRWQAIRALAGARAASEGDRMALLPWRRPGGEDGDAAWARLRREIEPLRPRWSEAQGAWEPAPR